MRYTNSFEIPLIALVILTMSLASCVLHKCDKAGVKNEYNFESFKMNVENENNEFLRGDTIRFHLSVSMFQFDSISNSEIIIDEGILVNLEISTIDPQPGGPPFTIIDEFDQHFRTIVMKGKKVNPFHYECQLVNQHWILEISLIPKQISTYYSMISINDLKLTNHPDDFCLIGGDFYHKIKIHFEVANDRTHEIFPGAFSSDLFDTYIFEVK